MIHAQYGDSDHGITCTPKLLALPTSILAMDSNGKVFIWSSVAFIFAISYRCLRLIVPVTSCPGFPVPFSIPAACLMKYEAGGVFVTKVKVRSGWTVMRVGMGTPDSMCAVLALNSLQKSMDFTPRAPRAGPTGGVGAAFPAGISKRLVKDGQIIQHYETQRVYHTTICALALPAALDMLDEKKTADGGLSPESECALKKFAQATTWSCTCTPLMGSYACGVSRVEWNHNVKVQRTRSFDFPLTINMKSFSVLLSFVSLIAATPLKHGGQTPFSNETPIYPGFDLDLDALRLVQLEGQSPVWMTELEKARVPTLSSQSFRTHVTT